MVWNSNIPLVGNQLAEDWADINENFTHLKNFLANIVNDWDSTTATNMFIAKTKRTGLTYADSPYTMLNTDVLMEVDASGGAITINVVSAATLGAGRFFMVKVTDATNDVTIEPNGTETIDGASNLVISTTNLAYIIYSDGANLQVLSFYADWLNQAVKTTSDVNFNTVTLAGAAGATPTANKMYKDSIVKAWINFNGTGTIAINDSFNVTSITDNGTGNYTITWDTDFADANYAWTGNSGSNSNPALAGPFATYQLAGSLQIAIRDDAAVFVDKDYIGIIAIGDQ